MQAEFDLSNHCWKPMKTIGLLKQINISNLYNEHWVASKAKGTNLFNGAIKIMLTFELKEKVASICH